MGAISADDCFIPCWMYGGEEVDSSGYEDQIAELEEMLEMQNQTIAQESDRWLGRWIVNATQMIKTIQKE